jgi:hypothetical protein
VRPEITQPACFVVPVSECICYPGMCPMGCEPACPYCFQHAVIEYGEDGLPVDWVGPLPEEFRALRRPKP